MRIGINGTFWDKPATGSGQYLRELLTAMAECAPENEYVSVVLEDELLSDVNEVAPRVFIYPESLFLARLNDNVGKVWFEQAAFNRVCRREHVALAHVPYFGSPLFPAVPTVVTIHDLIPLLLPLYRGSPLIQLYTQLVSAAAGRAHAIIADSECTRRDIVRHLAIPESRVHVVYLAANARYRPIADVAAIRHKYAMPENSILYFGGFDQRKNIRIVIEAMALLPELYEQGYRLVLAGSSLGKDSAFFPDPKRMASEVGLAEDAIRYVGWVAEADKPALYSSAKLFVFPSLYEGFGLPPLEAMACGTPVIASDRASLPEIVGEAGMLVEPTSSLAWAESIRAVLSNPARRREMRHRGLAQAAQFSWTRAAKETLAVYDSVLEM